MAGRLKSPSSLLAFAFQSFQVKQAPPREKHAVYVFACTCAYVCNSFSSPRSQSLREKNNYPDSVKSTWAIPLDTALNPAPENHWLTLSNRDTYVVLATGCLMGTHVILSSRFFLLFAGREDAYMSNWHFYFSSFKHLLACSNQVGEAGPGSPNTAATARRQEGHRAHDHLPKISGNSQKHKWVSMSLLSTCLQKYPGLH